MGYLKDMMSQSGDVSFSRNAALLLILVIIICLFTGIDNDKFEGLLYLTGAVILGKEVPKFNKK